MRAPIFAPCVTSRRFPGPFQSAMVLRNTSSCAARFCGRPNRLLSALNRSTLPAPISSAVSTQRHHSDTSTRPISIFCARSSRPSLRASSRPSSIRLRCVLQSSSWKPSGSPEPGVVRPCRTISTCPPALSAAKAASSAFPAPATASERKIAPISRIIILQPPRRPARRCVPFRAGSGRCHPPQR